MPGALAEFVDRVARGILNTLKSSTGSGLAFAFAGFALLSCGDALVKTMAGVWPGTAVAALRYGFGVLVLAGLLFAREGRGAFNIPRPWIQFGRGASVAVGSIFFFLSIFVMPLAEATLIQFVIPMLVAVISRIILKERPPRAAWIATAVAFIGVLIVLRPQVAAIGWNGLLPLVGALGMSFLMIFNRMASGLGSALKMQFLISVFAFPVLLLAALAGHFSGIASLELSWPAGSVIARCALIACSASLAHGLVYMATERASAAATAPAIYIQLIVAMLLGYLLYGDRPDAIALGGAVLIIGAGLYLWRAGRVVQAEAR
jgi:drug/metabolite transporter (DMT)-like permease